MQSTEKVSPPTATFYSKASIAKDSHSSPTMQVAKPRILQRIPMLRSLSTGFLWDVPFALREVQRNWAGKSLSFTFIHVRVQVKSVHSPRRSRTSFRIVNISMRLRRASRRSWAVRRKFLCPIGEDIWLSREWWSFGKDKPIVCTIEFVFVGAMRSATRS